MVQCLANSGIWTGVMWPVCFLKFNIEVYVIRNKLVPVSYFTKVKLTHFWCFILCCEPNLITLVWSAVSSVFVGHRGHGTMWLSSDESVQLNHLSDLMCENNNLIKMPKTFAADLQPCLSVQVLTTFDWEQFISGLVTQQFHLCCIIQYQVCVYQSVRGFP